MLSQSQIDWIKSQPYFVLASLESGAVLCEEKVIHQPSGRELTGYVQLSTWEAFSHWAGLGS